MGLIWELPASISPTKPHRHRCECWIGRAIALGFGEADATVINAEMREESKIDGEVIPTHERISDEGERAKSVKADVSIPE